LHQGDGGGAVDDRGDAIVRADLQEFRLELLVLADVDGMYRIGQPQLLEQDGSLAAVGGGPGIEIDHGSVPVLAIWRDLLGEFGRRAVQRLTRVGICSSLSACTELASELQLEGVAGRVPCQCPFDHPLRPMSITSTSTGISRPSRCTLSVARFPTPMRSSS